MNPVRDLFALVLNYAVRECPTLCRMSGRKTQGKSPKSSWSVSVLPTTPSTECMVNSKRSNFPPTGGLTNRTIIASKSLAASVCLLPVASRVLTRVSQELLSKQKGRFIEQGFGPAAWRWFRSRFTAADVFGSVCGCVYTRRLAALAKDSYRLAAMNGTQWMGGLMISVVADFLYGFFGRFFHFTP